MEGITYIIIVVVCWVLICRFHRRKSRLEMRGFLHPPSQEEEKKHNASKAYRSKGDNGDEPALFLYLYDDFPNGMGGGDDLP
jgi:hypothetical protein